MTQSPLHPRNWPHHHPSPKPVPVPVVPTPPPTPTAPTPPVGWTEKYSRNFVTQDQGDWVLQPGAGAKVVLSQEPGAEFGLGIQLNAPEEWAELISSDAVVTQDTFVQALLYIPMSGGYVANWPAFWTTGKNWPEDGEIDILEGQNGYAALQTHYGVLQGSGASENSPSQNAPLDTGGWLTLSLLRTGGQATAWYNSLKLGPVPMPSTADQVLIFQNQGQSPGNPDFHGPLILATAWMSKVAVWSK